MSEFTAEALVRWAQIVADWSDRMPLRHVYLFDKPRLHNDVEALGMAIEFNGDSTDAVMQNWTDENETDFAKLKKDLGTPLVIYAEPNDSAWPAIHNAAKIAKLTIGKVRVVPTP